MFTARARALATLTLVLGLACDTAPQAPDPGDAIYSVAYTPGHLVYATYACDRLLTHAVLSLSRRVHGFDLSVNLVDDCTRVGGGFSFWEVLILGDYEVTDTSLTFTPDQASTPAFTGSFDARSLRLTLPPRADSLAPTPIDVEFESKTPF